MTYDNYLKELKDKLSFLESVSDRASGLDERLDITNKLLFSMVDILREGMKLQLAPTPSSALPPYNVHKIDLSIAATADDPHKVELPGNMITFYSSGNYTGIEMAVDDPSNDWLPINELANPFSYPSGFKKVYLTWTAQVDRYLRIFVGRQAGASLGVGSTSASVQITAIAPKVAFYTIRSLKSTHFTDQIIQNAIESENLTGLLGNKIRIVGVALQSDQSLNYRVFFHKKDTFATVDLDTDRFCGEIGIDLPTNGFQIAGAGKYYLDMRGTDIDYEDEDVSSELHVSLQNLSAAAKNAGGTGEVTLDVYYELRS